MCGGRRIFFFKEKVTSLNIMGIGVVKLRRDNEDIPIISDGGPGNYPVAFDAVTGTSLAMAAQEDIDVVINGDGGGNLEEDSNHAYQFDLIVIGGGSGGKFFFKMNFLKFIRILNKKYGFKNQVWQPPC